jgi:hypothetical protein
VQGYNKEVGSFDWGAWNGVEMHWTCFSLVKLFVLLLNCLINVHAQNRNYYTGPQAKLLFSSPFWFESCLQRPSTSRGGDGRVGLRRKIKVLVRKGVGSNTTFHTGNILLMSNVILLYILTTWQFGKANLS